MLFTSIRCEMKFDAWMQERFGSEWVVAGRLTDKLRKQGYEVAIPQKKFKALQDEFYSIHPEQDWRMCSREGLIAQNID